MADTVIGRGVVEVVADDARFSAFAKALPNKFTAAAKVAKDGWNNVWVDNQIQGNFDKIGAAATKAGKGIRQAGTQGAMGLMILSQSIDDAQYGISALVNNAPQLGMSIGSALGASTEKAMAFGGAMGIAAVAVNTWVQRADHIKAIFGGSQSEDIQELTRDLTTMENAVRSLFATMANLDRGFNWVSTTREETNAVSKQMEDRASAAAAAEARAKQNRSTVAGARSTGEIQRGETFGKALAAYGGGDKLAEELYGKRTAGMNLGALSGDALATRQKYYREGIDSDIAAAMKGDQAALARIGKEAPGLKGHLAFNAPGAKEARDKAAAQKRTAIDRTAGKFSESFGEQFLNNPDMGLSETWGKLKEAMTEAGYSLKEIGDQLPGVAHKLKQDTLTKIKERAAAEGVDFETARGMMLSEAATRRANKAENTPLAREADRLAAAMEGGVGRRLLEDGGMSDANLEREVKKGLKASGMDQSAVDASAAMVAKKLRESVEQQVQGRALSEGVTEGQARADMLKEMNERRDQGGPKSEVMSTETYLNKLLVASAGGKSKEEIPRDQLAEAKTTNKLLGNVIKELAKPKTNEGVPTFARGRTR